MRNYICTICAFALFYYCSVHLLLSSFCVAQGVTKTLVKFLACVNITADSDLGILEKIASCDKDGSTLKTQQGVITKA